MARSVAAYAGEFETVRLAALLTSPFPLQVHGSYMRERFGVVGTSKLWSLTRHKPLMQRVDLGVNTQSPDHVRTSLVFALTQWEAQIMFTPNLRFVEFGNAARKVDLPAMPRGRWTRRRIAQMINRAYDLRVNWDMKPALARHPAQRGAGNKGQLFGECVAQSYVKRHASDMMTLAGYVRELALDCQVTPGTAAILAHLVPDHAALLSSYIHGVLNPCDRPDPALEASSPS